MVTSPEDAELVALRIGHHDPRRVTLPDVDPGSAELKQPRYLDQLIIGPEIQMQPVLAALVVRDTDEAETRIRAAGRRDRDHVVVTEHHFVPERLEPELGQPVRVVTVEENSNPSQTHARSIPPVPVGDTFS